MEGWRNGLVWSCQQSVGQGPAPSPDTGGASCVEVKNIELFGSQISSSVHLQWHVCNSNDAVADSSGKSKLII